MPTLAEQINFGDRYKRKKALEIKDPEEFDDEETEAQKRRRKLREQALARQD